MWTDEQVQMLINERKTNNDEFHSLHAVSSYDFICFYSKTCRTLVNTLFQLER